MGIRLKGLNNPRGLRVGLTSPRNADLPIQLSADQEVSHVRSEITSQEGSSLGIGANVDQYPVGASVLVITVQANSATYQNEVGKYQTSVVTGNNGVDTIDLFNLTTQFDPVNTTTLIIKTDYYRSLTIDEGTILSAEAWNGSSGGVLYLGADTITINGTLNGNALGYRGGNRGGNNASGRRGESLYAGIYNAASVTTLAGAGGAGLYYSRGSEGDVGNGGGSAGHGTVGSQNIWYGGNWISRAGQAGQVIAPGDLSRIYMGPGGGGGAGDRDTQSGYGGRGGNGGAIIVLQAKNVIIGPNGVITSIGANGPNPQDFGNGEPGGGGAGAGGTILFTPPEGSINIVNNGQIITDGGTTTRNAQGAGDGVVAIQNGSLTGNVPEHALVVS